MSTHAAFALFIRLRRPSSVCCKTDVCFYLHKPVFMSRAFLIYRLYTVRNNIMSSSLTICYKTPKKLIEGYVFTFHCSRTTFKWAKWATSSEKVAYFLVLFHNFDTMCRCVRYLVSIKGFCSLKLSSWREVPLLLSCSYKPSGLGSHGDTDALQALFAHQIRVFCCYNRLFQHFSACLSYV